MLLCSQPDTVRRFPLRKTGFQHCDRRTGQCTALLLYRFCIGLSSPFFLCNRKFLRISYYTKHAPRGSHCGGTEAVCFADPPQAENFASRNSFLFFRRCLADSLRPVCHRRMLPISCSGNAARKTKENAAGKTKERVLTVRLEQGYNGDNEARRLWV